MMLKSGSMPEKESVMAVTSLTMHPARRPSAKPPPSPTLGDWQWDPHLAPSGNQSINCIACFPLTMATNTYTPSGIKSPRNKSQPGTAEMTCDWLETNEMWA